MGTDLDRRCFFGTAAMTLGAVQLGRFGSTERGRAGYETYRHGFAKLIWQLASPRWKFDDATFARSAASFKNPDHVAIVIHNYRWRLALAGGAAKHDDLEKRLAEEGDANGAPHADPSSYAKTFSGKYSRRTIKGDIGHNLPQEGSAGVRQGCRRSRRLLISVAGLEGDK